MVLLPFCWFLTSACHFHIRYKTICIKRRIRHRFQHWEDLGSPFCRSPTSVQAIMPSIVHHLLGFHWRNCALFRLLAIPCLFLVFPTPLNIATLAKLIFAAYSSFLCNFATHPSDCPYSAQGGDELELSVSLPHPLGLDLFLFYKECMCPLNGAFAASCFVHYQLFQIHTSHRSLLFQKGHDGLLGIPLRRLQWHRLVGHSL